MYEGSDPDIFTLYCENDFSDGTKFTDPNTPLVDNKVKMEVSEIVDEETEVVATNGDEDIVCVSCNLPISDEALQIDDNTYIHPNCIQCYKCHTKYDGKI